LGLRAEAIHVAKAGVGARDLELGVTGRLSFLVLGPYDDEGGSQRGARIAEESGAEIPAAGWPTGLLVCHSGGGKLAVCHDAHGVPFWKAIPRVCLAVGAGVSSLDGLAVALLLALESPTAGPSHAALPSAAGVGTGRPP
jgi:hypothetical protein